MSKKKNSMASRVILWGMLIACFLELVFAIVMVCTDQSVSQLFKILFIACGSLVVLLSVISTVLAFKNSKKLALQIEHEKSGLKNKLEEGKKEE